MSKRFQDIIDLDVGRGCKGAFTKANYIFLYGFVFYLRPHNIIEIGSSFGVGTVTMALALKESKTPGHIYTYDIDTNAVSMVKLHSKQMKVDTIISSSVGTSNNVKELKIKRFDLAFIDGSHRYEGVMKDFNNLKNICNYIIFHDIQGCPEVQKFFKEVQGEKLGIMGINDKLAGMGLWKNKEKDEKLR